MNVNRRDFMKIGLITATAATFTACGRPVEHGVVSQYQMPEYALPGQPLFWATTCTDLRSDCAVSVKTVENRAIQVVGTPGHFLCKGYSNKEAISGLQVLYHPARLSESKGLKAGADGKPAETFGAVVAQEAQKASGATLFVVDRVCGSAGHALVQAAQAANAKIWVADSYQSVRERRILKAVTGRAELPFYALEKHDFVLSVGSNFLAENYAPSRTEWAYGRFRKSPGRLRGRMVTASTRMNPTDVNGDTWLALAPGSEATFLAAVGTAVAAKGKAGWPSWADVSVADGATKSGVSAEDIERLAARLAEAKSPRIVGGFQGTDGDATVFLAHTLTKMLNGDVPTFEPDMAVGSGSVSADLFLNDQEAASFLGSAKAVVVHGVDLVYRFPWLAESFKKVKTRVVMGCLPNDTTGEATHLVPLRSWLEDWGDLRVDSPDGPWYGVTQPVVRSWVGGAESVLGFYLDLAKQLGAAGVTEVSPRKVLQGERSQTDWEALLVRGGFWKEVPDDMYPNRANDPPPAVANSGSAPSGYSPFSSLSPLTVSSLAALPAGLVFVALPTHLADGEMSSRPWMQELPDAMTTVVWDSWVEINEEWAKENGIARFDLVEVTAANGKKIEGSAYLSPFISPSAVGIPTGRGQKLKPLTTFVDLGWESDGSNPQELFDGGTGSNGYLSQMVAGATIAKRDGSKLLATFDQRVYNLPRHILPE